jgi:dipeptidyl aminopeptidase/acylaminoacyl peptidase
MLFADPDADIFDVYSSAGEVIGVVYEREGLTQFHHIDSFYDRYQRSLAHALPDAVPNITSASQDRRYFVVLASSPRDPGTYYVLDTQTNTATRIARMMPWLDAAELADVEAIRVTSTDRLELEAFLARPRAPNLPPLVVLPHGGPWRIRDARSFDPLVQSLAAGGFAVLQVNYRGSSGRGQAFLDAGKQQWGKGIEQDLEAAVDEVVRRGLVDGDRVCIAGGSYGGYSALMSVIRSPTRYRCAISLNGPTDLLFEYHFYFKRGGEEGKTYFSEYIADPDDPEQLRSMSPVYRASEINVPVLLIQGGEDRRVDVDHYHRMLNMLEALGKPHDAYLIQDAGHSPTRSQWLGIVARMRTFLSKNLGPN